MMISVIIPAYSMDRLDDIHRAVESLEAQTCNPYEVIIAVDHNRELAEHLKSTMADRVIVTLNTKIDGGAETRNAGIYVATGDIVAFLDDDAWADASWLEKLADQYRNQEVVAVGGKTISIWDTGRPSWFPEELDWLVGGTWKGHPDGPCEIRNLIGPNMSFRRSVCAVAGYMTAELGALGHGFRAGDETEFYLRVKHHMPDKKIIFEPGAIVYHKVYSYKSTFGQLCTRSYSLGYYKSRATKLLRQSTATPFRSERDFLGFLLWTAIPDRLKHRRFRQSFSIAASIMCCGIGYMKGRV